VKKFKQFNKSVYYELSRAMEFKMAATSPKLHLLLSMWFGSKRPCGSPARCRALGNHGEGPHLPIPKAGFVSNCILIGSAIFAQHTHVTNTQTDIQTMLRVTSVAIGYALCTACRLCSL